MAAGSGVSSYAIQIAHAVGARVIATAGSDEKLVKAREIGADEVINHYTEDIAVRVQELTDGQGVELYYNIEINKWLHLTPDLQFIKNEFRGDDLAIIPGIRAVIDF